MRLFSLSVIIVIHVLCMSFRICSSEIMKEVVYIDPSTEKWARREKPVSGASNTSLTLTHVRLNHYSFQIANIKGADRTARKRWLICAFVVIPRRSWRDIVLALSVRPSVHSVRPHFLSVRSHISVPIGLILFILHRLVRFYSFLVQMISTIDSQYSISFVKIDLLTLELLPLF